MYRSNRPDVLRAIAQATERTLEGIGSFVEGEAIARAPVDTGNLRSSITHQVNTQDKSVAIGTPVDYSIYQELGSSRNTAQPFLEPSVNENRNRIQSLANQLMRL